MWEGGRAPEGRLPERRGGPIDAPHERPRLRPLAHGHCRSPSTSSSPPSASPCRSSWCSPSGAGGGRAPPVYLELARRWAKGTAILFAVGAVSGTVISFELGLLWPRLHGASPARSSACPSRSRASPSSPRPSSSASTSTAGSGSRPRLHLASGVVVAASGARLGLLRHARQRLDEPSGRLRPRGSGAPRTCDPLAAMFPPGWAHEVVHVLLSCYAATGFAVAGIHAFLLRREPASRFHRAALADRAGGGRGGARSCSRCPATSRPGRWRSTSR